MSISSLRRKQRVRYNLKKRNIKNPKIRMSIHVSNKNMYVQLIDDKDSKTLLSSSTLVNSSKSRDKSVNVEYAKELGRKIAKEAIANNISEVVFDRGSLSYHGQIKSFCEAAREEGLKF